MELCTSQAISNLPRSHHRLLFTPPQARSNKPSLLSFNIFSIPRIAQGCVYYRNSSLRATSSEETSTGSSQYSKEVPVATAVEVRPAETNSYDAIAEREESTVDNPTDGETQAFEFLDKLDVKLDSEDTSSLLLLGGGSLVALWIATVVVGAIDSIPLFPKLMEVIGLSYSLWFSTRYLLFKKNREELVVKIEEIKQQVLGSNNN